MDNLLKGRLLPKTYHPKLSSQWLTLAQWVSLFEDEYEYITIGNESAMNYYGENKDKSYFVIYFTTQLSLGGKVNYLLMGAICELTSPEKNSVPDDFYLGDSIAIKSLINFGRLNEFIERYDLTFDNQTMDADIVTLSQLKEFRDLSEMIEFGRIQGYKSAYLGHFDDYSDFLSNLKLTLNEEGII